MVKLAWTIKHDEHCLWAKVLRAKYNFSYQINNYPQPKPSSSPTWKGLCQVWQYAEEGGQWEIGNGKTIMFWRDKWVTSHTNLMEHLPNEDPHWHLHLHVAYFTVNDDGNWKLIKKWLPQDSCDKIAMLDPPKPDKGDDKLFWKFSEDGKFKISHVYPLFLDEIM